MKHRILRFLMFVVNPRSCLHFLVVELIVESSDFLTDFYVFLVETVDLLLVSHVLHHYPCFVVLFLLVLSAMTHFNELALVLREGLPHGRHGR